MSYPSSPPLTSYRDSSSDSRHRQSRTSPKKSYVLLQFVQLRLEARFELSNVHSCEQELYRCLRVQGGPKTGPFLKVCNPMYVGIQKCSICQTVQLFVQSKTGDFLMKTEPRLMDFWVSQTITVQFCTTHVKGIYAQSVHYYNKTNCMQFLLCTPV